MALNFPATPSDGQTYTDPITGNSYIYSATYQTWNNSTNVSLWPDYVTASPTTSQNNYSPGINSAAPISTLSLTPNNIIKITGIDTTNWPSGKILTIRNDTNPITANSQIILLDHLSSQSVSTNQFNRRKRSIDSGVPMVIPPGRELMFRFDGTKLTMIQLADWGGIYDRSADGAIADYYYTGTTSGTNSAYASGWDFTDTAGRNIFRRAYRYYTGTTSSGWSSAIWGGWTGPARFSDESELHICNFGLLTLATGSDNYNVYIGLGYDPSSGQPTSFTGWTYNFGVSNSWQTLTRTSGSNTFTVQSLGAVVANVSYMLGSFLNGNASRADFFHSTDDGDTWVIDTSHTTNIPGNSNYVTQMDGIYKSSGTNPRAIFVQNAYIGQYYS